MILLAHLLFGATIASYIKNSILAVVLAFFSHYLLDFLPHAEYSISNKKTAIFKIAVDFCLGILLIYILSDNLFIIYVCAFVAIIPDGLTVLSRFLPNKFFSWYNNLHSKKIHFLKYKKIPIFWRIFSQVLVVAIFLILLIQQLYGF